MTQPPHTSAARTEPQQDNRSESLLPADQTDPNLQVAEEVAFDLQSDEARRVGAMPKDTAQAKPAQAVADALRAPAEGKPQAGST
ncbi:hypothetical protein KY495_19800 [Massilia sp. PAMC28688]|uniref:hypothetical protein n=1 Tax=Massilia sp. PAMC28688 TaxID=2861283 RepID=UPI001C624DF1|nr:hypothetical protein [Massilia sp. PAMC28688]QYF92932.1 hypothetical protein KY495_19800 [Massilia sp. PAMC28688]